MGQKEIYELNTERLKEIGDSPAYPVNTPGEYHNGMSLREYIATQAMSALLSRDDIASYRHEDISMMSVRQADDLIKALHTRS